MKKLVIILALLTTIQAHTLSKYQLHVLRMINKEALTHPNKHGEPFGKTLSLIAMQESSLGLQKVGDIHLKHKRGYSMSYGLFQFQIRTAREVISKTKEFRWMLHKSDAWLTNKLVRDDKFSVKLAVRYINRLSMRFKNWAYLISAWNGMPKGVPTRYYRAVTRWKPLIYSIIKGMKDE